MADGPEQREATATASPSAWPARPVQPARDPQAPLAPGACIDRYEVIELVGEGSMGAVYRARDLDLGREVALKRIKPGRVDVWRAQTQLHREAQTMARIEHPAVVRVYNVGIADGQLFIAMELARGGSVAAWAKAGRRSWREVVRVFVDAGRGLAAAHREGIVHRDIKPSNLLLDAHGRAKVSDFGVARVLADDRDSGDAGRREDGVLSSVVAASVEHTGGVVGTLAYMAPEQLIGGPIDPRADQFGFCVALWTVLCGQRPFVLEPDAPKTGSPEHFHRAIVAGRIAAAHRHVPRRILALIRRGLMADRAARWPAMDDLLDALERALRPRRWRWSAAVMVGLAIAGAAVWAARPGEPRGAPAAAPRAPATCGAHDQLAKVWTPAARATYLAAPGDAKLAQQDAGWFDDYARALDRAYGDACGHAAPEVIRCLDDAVDDLRTALTRHDRKYWPRLRALDRCGKRWRVRDLGASSNAVIGLLAPDRRQVVLHKDQDAPLIRNVDDLNPRALALANPVRWLGDGAIVGGAADGEIAVIDPTTSKVRSLAHPRGELIDVSADLSTIAMWADRRAVISPIAGGPPLMSRAAAVSAPWGKFSPSGRYFGLLDPESPDLLIHDLRSRQVTAIPIRVHQHGTGIVQAGWIDDTQLLINGSAVSGVAADVWRLRIDRGGQWIGPPEVWVEGERDTAMWINDVQVGRLLVTRVRIATHNTVLDGRRRTDLQSSGMWLYPSAPDRPHRRILVAVANHVEHKTWAWMSVDGAQLTALPELDELDQVVVAPHGLLALDTRGDAPSLIAFDDRGRAQARLALAWTRGGYPSIMCGPTRCVVRWGVDHDFAAMVIEQARDGRPTLGRPLHHAENSTLTNGPQTWDVSPDGRWIAAPKALSSVVMLYDLEHGEVRHVSCKTCESVQQVRFTPDGGLLISADVERTVDEYILVHRALDGSEDLVARGDQWISTFMPLDDHKILLHTVAYQRGFHLLEPE